jgi:hypothetical protein
MLMPCFYSHFTELVEEYTQASHRAFEEMAKYEDATDIARDARQRDDLRKDDAQFPFRLFSHIELCPLLHLDALIYRSGCPSMGQCFPCFSCRTPASLAVCCNLPSTPKADTDKDRSELALRQQEYSLFKTSMQYDEKLKTKLIMGYCERRIQRVQHFEQDFTRIKGAIAHLE